MEEKAASLARIRAYHIICVGFLVGSLAFSIFRFSPVAVRVWQSVKDLGVSLAYYFSELFNVGRVTPTVTELPDGIQLLLPQDPETFKTMFGVFARRLIDLDNLLEFIVSLGDKLAIVAKVLLILLLPTCLVILLLVVVYSKTNTSHNKDTTPLKVFKKLEKTIWQPPKRFVLDFVEFVRDSRYIKLFLFIWAWNFNVITIVLEVFAYLFYFSFSFDFGNIYVQLLKLLMDVSVPVGFLPWWAWLIVGCKIFDVVRRSRGLQKLRHFEDCNRTFLDNHPGALFLVGKQRSRKTTIITDMALSQEVIFRTKAKEKLAERDKQFPYFPWINVELFYKRALAEHKIYTLALCRKFVKEMRFRFKHRKAYSLGRMEVMLDALYKIWGYKAEDFIFGYDYERYGTTYNDALGVVDIFEAIEGYLQMYFVYAAPTSLVFGNYPIRTDFQWDDKGNFPVFCGDFFETDPRMVKENSKYSHIQDMDAMRLGEVTDPNNPYKDGFEVGIVTETEYAKERGNQNSNAGVKATDKTVNPKNDLHEMHLKTITHAATIDNFTIFRLLIDDHREDSLAAENKDLCDIIHIKKVDGAKIVMPGFAFGELMELVATGIYDKLYYRFRNLRGDNTLLVYLMKKLYIPIHNHYVRIFNQYSVYVARVKVWDAMGDEVLDEKGKYYISTKKTYSGRFATDALKGFYNEKALQSQVGLNDYKTYGGVNMTVEEMDAAHSLFYDRILKIFRREEKDKKKGEKNA